MQDHRTPGVPLRVAHPPRPGSVQGWGLSDALRVDLESSQIESCLAEIRELIGVYEEALQRALQVDLGSRRRDELDRQAYELRVLAAMHSQLVHRPSDLAPVLVGPAGLVLQVISGATTNAVQQLAERLGERRFVSEGARDELAHLAALAACWVGTFLASQAVQWFSYDLDHDIPRP